MRTRVLKLLYPGVILRTSFYPAFLGATVAWVVVGAPLNALNIALTVLLILVVQGMVEHPLDTLHDKGGYSAFRDEAAKLGEARLRRTIKVGLITAAVLNVILVALGAYWIPLITLLALRSAYKYVKTHNEWFAVFGFQLSYMVGYFGQTNVPTVEWFTGAVIIGFLYKPAMMMYRLDDYLMENTRPEVLIQYYRNVMRGMLHQVPFLVATLILAMAFDYPLTVLGYTFDALWAINAAVTAVEVAVFWRRHHGMCNVFRCPRNPLLRVKVPR